MSERIEHTPDDDWIERALRSDARDHAAAYLPDDGFTARVMAKLPPPAALPAWRRSAVALMWTLAGAGTAMAFPDVALDVARETVRLLVQPNALPQIAAGALALGAALWTAAAYLLKDD